MRNPSLLRLFAVFGAVLASIAGVFIIASSRLSVNTEVQLIAPDIAVVGFPIPFRVVSLADIDNPGGASLRPAGWSLKLISAGSSPFITLQRGEGAVSSGTFERGVWTQLRDEQVLRLELWTGDQLRAVKTVRVVGSQVAPRSQRFDSGDSGIPQVRYMGGHCAPEQPCVVYVSSVSYSTAWMLGARVLGHEVQPGESHSDHLHALSSSPQISPPRFVWWSVQQPPATCTDVTLEVVGARAYEGAHFDHVERCLFTPSPIDDTLLLTRRLPQPLSGDRLRDRPVTSISQPLVVSLATGRFEPTPDARPVLPVGVSHGLIDVFQGTQSNSWQWVGAQAVPGNSELVFPDGEYVSFLHTNPFLVAPAAIHGFRVANEQVCRTEECRFHMAWLESTFGVSEPIPALPGPTSRLDTERRSVAGVQRKMVLLSEGVLVLLAILALLLLAERFVDARKNERLLERALNDESGSKSTTSAALYWVWWAAVFALLAVVCVLFYVFAHVPFDLFRQAS